jgi:hypothetical protein
MELISLDNDGHGVIIHVDKVAADFSDLIQQFDRDPYRAAMAAMSLHARADYLVHAAFGHAFCDVVGAQKR